MLTNRYKDQGETRNVFMDLSILGHVQSILHQFRTLPVSAYDEFQ